MWIVSIFFLLSTFLMFSTTWAAILFIIPAILLNPITNNFLQNRLGFNNKWWIKLCSILIPIVIYTIFAPTISQTIAPISTSSALNSSAIVSENSAVSSTTPSITSSMVSSMVSSTTSPIVSANSPTTTTSKTVIIDKKSSSINQPAPSTASKSTTPTPKSTTSATSKASVVVPSTDNQSLTVYITDTGAKYHNGSCRTLKKSKIAMSLKDAKAKGYTSCGICHPPQ